MATKDPLDESLALIISATKRKTRPVSIVAIADAIFQSAQILGSVSAVSDRVGLSSKMLGQFLMVRKLCPEVRELVETRTIDSVDAIAHLSQLPPAHQCLLARDFSAKELTTADVRAIVELWKKNQSQPIHDLMQKVKKSRTIKQYIFEFIARGGADAAIIKNKLLGTLLPEQVLSLGIQSSKGSLIVTKDGCEALKKCAKKLGIQLRNVVPELLR